jgi:hypothetical protein
VENRVLQMASRDAGARPEPAQPWRRISLWSARQRSTFMADGSERGGLCRDWGIGIAAVCAR